MALAGCGSVWGEVRSDAGRLVLEVFGRPDGGSLLLPADELRETLVFPTYPFHFCYSQKTTVYQLG